MRSTALLLTACLSLLAHPVRSALTILGIVIGVASVIAVVAVGAGSRQAVEERLQSIGANLLLITQDAERGVDGRIAIMLTTEDALAIQREISHLRAVAPSVYRRERVIFGGENRETTVQGITDDYLVAREWPVAEGRSFTREDLTRSAKVIMLGVTVRRHLFGTGSPLDRIVRIGDVPFTVIGTMTGKGLSSAGSDQDDRVFVPVTTAQNILDGSRDARRGKLDYVMVKVDREDHLQGATDDIKSLLMKRHRRDGWEQTSLEVSNLAEVLETRREASSIFGRSLVAVALISLVVGGISVMNIMLVSVSERTHEIGLRMALGARQQDIRIQFLLESLMLTLVAGLLGVGLGIASSLVIAWLADWPVILSLTAISAGVICAVGTGLASGLYPALRAAALDPIEALRFE